MVSRGQSSKPNLHKHMNQREPGGARAAGCLLHLVYLRGGAPGGRDGHQGGTTSSQEDEEAILYVRIKTALKIFRAFGRGEEEMLFPSVFSYFSLHFLT